MPPGHGLQWARDGLEIFAAAPTTWIGIVVLFFLLGVVLSAIPFAGMLWSVVVPIHVGGLMLGCEAMRHGRPLEIRHLFNGFEQPRLQPLALVGALYLAATLVVMIPAIVLVLGGTVFSAALIGSNPGAASAATVVGLVGLVFVLMTVLGFALSMAIWFAPALVVFRQVEALDALKASFRAAWENVGAFLVFGLTLLGAGLAAISPFMASIFLVAARRTQVSDGIVIVLIGGTALFTFLCVLVFMPTMWGAMYASYRDVFGED